MSYIEPFEFIFNNDSAKGIHSGGFSVNSIMMRKGISPIKTWNTGSDNEAFGDEVKSGGSKVSDLFQSMVVPNWAYSSGKLVGGSNEERKSQSHDEDSESEDDYIHDDIHDKLLQLVTEYKTVTPAPVVKKNKITRKNKQTKQKNGGTKKMKNKK
jgi:hypothetical protein